MPAEPQTRSGTFHLDAAPARLLPLFTALIASALLGETIHAHHWLGGGLILLGVSLTQGGFGSVQKRWRLQAE